MAATSFSTILQGLRKEKKVTQEMLANHLGVSPQAVSKWENGSYPEGDLLPRIADYFSVSIDYLYGRAEKDTPITQKVLMHFKELLQEEQAAGTDMSGIAKFWEEMYAVIWAVQISPWGGITEYFDRLIADRDDTRAASVMFNNYGYSYMNLDRGNEFYMLLKKSSLDAGFAHWMKHSGKVRELFRVLSSEDNVKVLMYLYSLGYDEYANAATISAETGVPTEKTEKLMEYLLGDITEEKAGKYPLCKIRVAMKDGRTEVAYGVDMNLAGLLFGIFNIADSYVHNPYGYNMQIANRTEPWIDPASVRQEHKGKK